MPTLSVVLLGAWHVHARDYAEDVLRHPDTTLCGVWDEDEVRGRALAENYGVPYISSLDAALADYGADAVIVTTATADHERVIGAAARAKKHIFTEKVIAATADERDRILGVVLANDVRIETSLPRLYHGYTEVIDRVIDSDVLGFINYVRVRLAHDGGPAGWLPARFYDLAEACGGAITDLGCHPLYLVDRFVRQDSLPRVRSTYARVQDRGVDDNSVVTLSYENGVIGVAEASFVTGVGAFGIEIHGERGSLLYGFGSEELRVTTEQSARQVYQLLPDRATAFERFVTAIHSREQDHDNLRVASRLTDLVEASNRSAHAEAVQI